MVPGMRTMRLRTNVLAPLAVLLTPLVAFAQEHGEEGGGGGLFDINVGLMAWTMLIFTALLIVLWRFAWGPILAAVEAREKGIQDSLDQWP